MTCREKFEIEFPGFNCMDFCPYEAKIAEPPEYCTEGTEEDICEQCWAREIPIEIRKDANMVETKIDLESMVDLVCDARIKLTNHGFTNVEAFWIIKTLLEGIVK